LSAHILEPGRALVSELRNQATRRSNAYIVRRAYTRSRSPCPRAKCGSF
jgi:hypothetical protein